MRDPTKNRVGTPNKQEAQTRELKPNLIDTDGASPIPSQSPFKEAIIPFTSSRLENNQLFGSTIYLVWRFCVPLENPTISFVPKSPTYRSRGELPNSAIHIIEGIYSPPIEEVH